MRIFKCLDDILDEETNTFMGSLNHFDGVDVARACLSSGRAPACSRAVALLGGVRELGSRWLAAVGLKETQKSGLLSFPPVRILV